MSVKFDPKSQSPASSDRAEPPSKRRLNLLEQWVDSVYEGVLQESLSPRTYCERAWEQKKTAPTAKEGFMQDCMLQCAAYKQYCEWSRKN